MVNELLMISRQRPDAWEAAPVSALEEQLTAIRDALDTHPRRPSPQQCEHDLTVHPQPVGLPDQLDA
jgi:hypothetical protein